MTGSAAYRRNGTTWESDAGGHEERGITYDVNGNVLTMQRTAGGVVVDDLSYAYAGNRLAGVTESAAPAGGEDVYARGDASRGTYEHDANGNMIKDSRNALIYRYNVLNLLRGVETGSGESVASYTWLSDGSKLRVRSGDGGSGFDYLGSLTIVKDNAGERLESVQTGEGVILVGAGGEQAVTYHLTDHLGSVRVIVDSTGTVLERNDYYPFGSRHPRADYPLSGNRHKYNGKEEQQWGGQCYLDYGWRMYDAALGRWHAMDPLAEEYASHSPYNYCLGNPVILVDPDGSWVETPFGGLTTSDPSEIYNFWSALQYEFGTREDWSDFGSWAWDFAMSDTWGAPLFQGDGTLFASLSEVQVRGSLSNWHVTLESMIRWCNEMGAITGSRDYFKDVVDSGYLFGRRSPLSMDDIQILFNQMIVDREEFINHPATQITLGIMTSFIPVGAVGNIGKVVKIGGGIGKVGRGNFAQRLFLSEKFGITSAKFGNAAAHAKGSLNQSGNFFKLGWSTAKNFKNEWGYKFRIGVGAKGNKAMWHFYMPKSFVPNGFANPSINVKRSLFKLDNMMY